MQQLAQALGLRRLLGSSTSAAVTAAAAAAAAPARPLASAAAGSEGRAKTSASASAGAAPPDTEASPDKCMATGLPLSAPPPKELRERVEQVAIQEIEALSHSAATGAAADPELRAAAAETLAAWAESSEPLQELDQAGEWESMLASAGVINSPADYPGTGRQGKPGSGSSEGSDVAGGAKGG